MKQTEASLVFDAQMYCAFESILNNKWLNQTIIFNLTHTYKVGTNNAVFAEFARGIWHYAVGSFLL